MWCGRRSWTRRHGGGKRPDWCRGCWMELTEPFDKLRRGTWACMVRYGPHAEAVLDEERGAGSGEDETVRRISLLRRVAAYHSSCVCSFVHALELLEHAVREGRAVLGEDHPSVGAMLNSMALVHHE